MQAATERRHTVPEPQQARALAVIRATDTVVGDLDQQPVAERRTSTCATVACAYFATLVSDSAIT